MVVVLIVLLDDVITGSGSGPVSSIMSDLLRTSESRDIFYHNYDSLDR